MVPGGGVGDESDDGTSVVLLLLSVPLSVVVGAMVVGRGVGAGVIVVGSDDVILIAVPLLNEGTSEIVGAAVLKIGAAVMVGARLTRTGEPVAGRIVGAGVVGAVAVGAVVAGAVVTRPLDTGAEVTGESVGDLVTGDGVRGAGTGAGSGADTGALVEMAGDSVKGTFDATPPGDSVGASRTGAGAGARVIKTKGGKATGAPCRLRSS